VKWSLQQTFARPFDSRIIEFLKNFFRITIYIEFSFRRVKFLFKLFNLFINDRAACRLHKSFLKSNSFINRNPMRVELFKKDTINLNYGYARYPQNCEKEE
jgi:hypothetical protein